MDSPVMQADQTSLDRALIQSSFTNYSKFMLTDFEDSQKSFPFKWYHYVMMERIEAAIEGKELPRMGFFLPPRHGKTLLAGTLFLSYMFGRFPHKVGAYGTYNEEYAKRGRDAFEKIVTSKKYLWLFPRTRIKTMITSEQKKRIKALKTVSNTAYVISNALSPTGRVVFVGRGSGLTGNPMHYGSCDDLYKDESECLSEKVNDSIWSWFINVWMSRSEKGCMHFLFYTRWGDNDVAGKLIEGNEALKDQPGYIPWSFYRFPAYKDDDDSNPYDTRQEGEPLDPDMEFQYSQAKIREGTYNALYQQKPLGAGEIYLLKGIPWSRYIDLPKLNYIVISIDTTVKEDSKTVDMTAISAWGLHGVNIYMLPYFVNKKMDFVELEEQVTLIIQKYPNYSLLLIEESASGPALHSRVKRYVPRSALHKVDGRSKRERMQYVLPYIKSGQVHLPSAHICPQISVFEKQSDAFTGINKKEQDDLLDTLVMTIQYYESIGIFNPKANPILVQRSSIMATLSRQQMLPALEGRVIHVAR